MPKIQQSIIVGFISQTLDYLYRSINFYYVWNTWNAFQQEKYSTFWVTLWKETFAFGMVPLFTHSYFILHNIYII